MQSKFNRVFIASDHAGLNVKSIIHEYLSSKKDALELKSIIDFGPFDADRTDYPHFAQILCNSIQEKMCGILVCARGIGMSIAANRFPHIRAGLCYDVRATFFARSHSNANVLVISADAGNSLETIKEMINTFLSTEFAAGRYQERLDMISNITEQL